MKYNKGDKFRTVDGELELFYMGQFEHEDEGTIIVCGGGSCAHELYIPESELEWVDATENEKILGVMVDLANTMKSLATDVGNLKEIFFEEVENASEVMDENKVVLDEDPAEEDIKKNRLN